MNVLRDPTAHGGRREEALNAEHLICLFVCLTALGHNNSCNNSAYTDRNRSDFEFVSRLATPKLQTFQPSCYYNLCLESDLRRLFVYTVAIPIGSCHHQSQSQLVGIFTALAGNNVGECCRLLRTA